MSRSPAFRLSIGVVSLLACALLSADMFFDLFPASDAGHGEQRLHLAEVTTAQLARRVVSDDFRAIARDLDAVRDKAPEIQAIAVRNAQGALIARSGAASAAGAPGEVVMPIQSGQGEWGRVTFVFEPEAAPSLFDGWGGRRSWQFAALGFALFAITYFYLRRAMLYLDPMSVVPERLRAVFDSLTEGIAVLDQKQRVVLGNRALCKLAGVADGKLLGRRLEDAARLAPDDQTGAPVWQQVIESGQAVTGTRVQIGPPGARRTGSMNCAPVVDGLGKVRGCLVTVADVTEIEQSNDQLRAALTEVEIAQRKIEAQNEELQRLALYDGLTALHNRRAFFQRASEAIIGGVRGRWVAVLMLDVDHFKSFNDRYGHATGDLVLQQVARGLEEGVRAGDIAARYGGEEFCVLAEGIDEAQALQLAERIRLRIETSAGQAIEQDGATLRVTVSIGVAIARIGDAELSALVKRADVALYASKHAGRNRVTLASTEPEGLSRKNDAAARNVSFQ